MSEARTLTVARFRDLRPRVTTVLIAVPVLGLVLNARPVVFAVVVSAAALLACREIAAITLHYPGRSRGWKAAMVMAGVGACLALAVHLTLLRTHALDGGTGWVLLALCLTWGGDVGGYLVGRQWGRRRLAARISPGKTVAGAWASLCTGVFLAFLLRSAGVLAIDVVPLLLLAVPGQILAQLGDLGESAFKRAHGAKDSSALFPGQGGMLDVLDGLFLVAPWLYHASSVVS